MKWVRNSHIFTVVYGSDTPEWSTVQTPQRSMVQTPDWSKVQTHHRVVYDSDTRLVYGSEATEPGRHGDCLTSC